MGRWFAIFVLSTICVSLITALRLQEYTAIYQDIWNLYSDNNQLNSEGFYLPSNVVRLGFHDAGTYSATSKNGGSHSIQSQDCGSGQCEKNLASNKGLGYARDKLGEVFSNYQTKISLADFWTLATNVAVKFTGGPDINFQWGRVDYGTDKSAIDRLPDPDGDINHIRSRMGRGRLDLSDREIVALMGAHSIGSAHESASGRAGPWDPSMFTFDNAYYKNLLSDGWKFNNKLAQFDRSASEHRTIMLPTDMAIKQDQGCYAVVREYADNQDQFFQDFAAAINKVQSLGHKLYDICTDEDTSEGCSFTPSRESYKSNPSPKQDHGPKPSGPNPKPSGSYSPKPSPKPDNNGPKPSGPKPSGSYSPKPKPSGPKPSGSYSPKPKPSGPKPSGSYSPKPKPSGPKPSGSYSPKPKPSGPKPSGSYSPKPKPSGPKPSGSYSPKPKPSGPKPSGSYSPKPKPSSPKPTGSYSPKPKPSSPKPTGSYSPKPKPSSPKPTGSYSSGNTSPKPKPSNPKPTGSYSSGNTSPKPKPSNPKPTGSYSSGNTSPKPKPSNPKPTGSYSSGNTSPKPKPSNPKPTGSYSSGNPSPKPKSSYLVKEEAFVKTTEGTFYNFPIWGGVVIAVCVAIAAIVGAYLVVRYRKRQSEENSNPIWNKQ